MNLLASQIEIMDKAVYVHGPKGNTLLRIQAPSVEIRETPETFIDIRLDKPLVVLVGKGDKPKSGQCPMCGGGGLLP